MMPSYGTMSVNKTYVVKVLSTGCKVMTCKVMTFCFVRDLRTVLHMLKLVLLLHKQQCVYYAICGVLSG